MIFTVISPDKISQSMFCDLCKTFLTDKPLDVIDINCLYSNEIQAGIMNDLLDKKDSRHTFIKYKIKVKTKMESIPAEIIKLSDYVIKFDIYSSHPDVIKSENKEFLDNLLIRWQSSVEKI